jgi:hypothetical protein
MGGGTTTSGRFRTVGVVALYWSTSSTSVRCTTAPGDSARSLQELLRVTGHLLLDRRPLPMLPPIAGVSRLVEIELELLARRVSVDDGESPP